MTTNVPDHLQNSRPLSADEQRHFSWLQGDDLKLIFQTLNTSTQIRVRAVGGCVRDSLLGQTPSDIDLATDHLPEAVLEKLSAKGVRVIPTGLSHGTVTAILPSGPMEITTLRRDEQTDGRHATVAFTDDWKIDAERRDFTMNALFVGADNRLYDPVGGWEDLQASRVQFIGNANERIKEDYLRILRFFRFSARFAKHYDEVAIAAIGNHLTGLESLSRERVGAELLKIISLPQSPVTLTLMKELGVLGRLIDAHADTDCFARWRDIVRSGDVVTGLNALYPSHDEAINDEAVRKRIGAALRLSNQQCRQLDDVERCIVQVSKITDKESAKRALYHVGKDLWVSALSLGAARGNISKEIFNSYQGLPGQWEIPIFPIGGNDLVDLGMVPGPDFSECLAAIENLWIEKKYPNRDVALQIARDYIASK